MRVFRTMRDDGGRPATGRARDRLGVRVPGEGRKPDVYPGSDGWLEPVHEGAAQGMSAIPNDPRLGDISALPAQLDGSAKGVLFEIDSVQLPAGLVVVETSRRHVVIAPAERMLLSEYE